MNDLNGIIYFVDMSDSTKLEESKEELTVNT
jgi:hypothetical protein